MRLAALHVRNRGIFAVERGIPKRYVSIPGGLAGLDCGPSPDPSHSSARRYPGHSGDPRSSAVQMLPQRNDYSADHDTRLPAAT